MPKHMRSARLNKLPEEMRRNLVAARTARGWSQRALGKKVGLPQAHISAIETGKVVPQFDTLLDLARSLGLDLVMVPAPLVPTIRGLVNDFGAPGDDADDGDSQTPLYADETSDDDEPRNRRR